MKKIIAILLILMLVFVLSSCSSTKSKIYINPIDGDSFEIEEDSEKYIYKNGSNVEEGKYIIGESAQKMIVTPLGASEGTTYRYYDKTDSIYYGNVWKYYSEEVTNGDYGSYFYHFNARSENNTSFNPYVLGQNDYYCVNGGIYYKNVFKEIPPQDDEAVYPYFQRIVRGGKDRLVGWYDVELAKKRILVCVYKSDFLVSDVSQDLHNMILALWDEQYAYSKMYINKDSDLYKQVNEAYKSLLKKRNMSYEEAMGLD